MSLRLLIDELSETLLDIKVFEDSVYIEHWVREIEKVNKDGAMELFMNKYVTHLCREYKLLQSRRLGQKIKRAFHNAYQMKLCPPIWQWNGAMDLKFTNTRPWRHDL